MVNGFDSPTKAPLKHWLNAYVFLHCFRSCLLPLILRTLAVNALTTTTSSSNSNNNNDNDNDNNHVNDHHRQQHYNHNHGHNNNSMNFYLGIVYGIGITSVIMFYLSYKPFFLP